MDNEKNYRINRSVLYGEGYYDSEQPTDRFENEGKKYVFTDDLKGRIFYDVTVTFKKDGKDARFAGIWRSHIFTEEEIAVLCGGGKVTFELAEGSLIYKITGGLKEAVKEVDPFSIPYNSSYKLYNAVDYEFVADDLPQEFVPEVINFDDDRQPADIYAMHEGELLKLNFDRRAVPDEKQLRSLLDGGVIELENAVLSENGKAAEYAGYVLRETVKDGAGYVIENMDGSLTVYDTSTALFRLYERSVTGGLPETKLFSMAYPEGMDYNKIACKIFGRERIDDLTAAGLTDEDISNITHDALYNNICFRSVWRNHIFTPDEIRALSRGESISFEYVDDSGSIVRVAGGLEVSGLHCMVETANGLVRLEADYIAAPSKMKAGAGHLPVYDQPYKYYCDMEFIPDGGMASYVPEPVLEDDFVSYDPDRFS
ncbi:hypothetical protein [Ruminococcus sp.]|uniref:hypothetical protein n=1 Tax=Ruminococcus sp. TaxID=41978 RepID=UPI0025F623C7|nr:hypothetical protein [Ruminococcus sp.]MBQ8966896.1 hypothetical protein [Ruminococcus sp.]